MSFRAKFQQRPHSTGSTAKKVMEAVTGRAPVITAAQAIEVNLNEALLDAVNQIFIPAMQAHLVDNESMFTSDLHDSFSVQADRKNSVVVTSGEDYAQFVEEGSIPRPIDDAELDNLVLWAQFKFSLSPNPEAIAVSVAESIEESGNKPHPYAAPALEETADAMYQMVARQFAVDMRLG